MSTRLRAVGLALFMAWGCGHAVAEPPPQTLATPDFFVRIALTPEAEAWLRTTGEVIKVSAMFEDAIGPGNLWLGNAEVTLTQDRVTHIHNIEFQPRLAQLLAGFDYEVLVGAYSGRKITDLNRLDCEPLQGPISQFQGRTSQIDCKLLPQQPTHKYVKRFTGEMTAPEFLSRCSSAALASGTPAGRRNEGFCVGYMKGVIHAHEGFLGHDGLPERHFCIPRGTSDLDIARAVVKYLEAHDAREFLGTYTLAALHVTYPCNPQRR